MNTSQALTQVKFLTPSLAVFAISEAFAGRVLVPDEHDIHCAIQVKHGALFYLVYAYGETGDDPIILGHFFLSDGKWQDTLDDMPPPFKACSRYIRKIVFDVLVEAIPA